MSDTVERRKRQGVLTVTLAPKHGREVRAQDFASTLARTVKVLQACERFVSGKRPKVQWLLVGAGVSSRGPFVEIAPMEYSLMVERLLSEAEKRKATSA